MPRPQHSRRDVLEAAETLLAEEGPACLSVRRIADALGVSRQIVYSRFDGKPALVRALHDEGFRRLGQAFATVTEAPGTTEHVLAMGRAYRAAALASPSLYELMFGRPVLEFSPDRDDRSTAATSFEPVVAAAAAWLRAQGSEPSRRQALRLASTVWAATHGVVSLELAGLLPSEAAQPTIDDMLAAVLAEHARHALRPGASLDADSPRPPR